MADARFMKVCVDAHDPLALGGFWAAALDYELEENDGPEGEREAGLIDATETWRLWFNRVTHVKSVKHRVHLDVYTRALADLEALGATVAARGRRPALDRDDGPRRWRVLRLHPGSTARPSTARTRGGLC